MTTTAYAFRDSATMLRRQLKRMLRYPSLTLIVIGLPVVLLLLFVYVFGGTLGDGLPVGPGTEAGGRAGYVNYLAPGIMLLAVVGSTQGTAISVALDMSAGIIARFRTMAIARVSVLTGHVLGSLIQITLALFAVTGVALLIGFRPDATGLEWLAVAGLLTLVGVALTWLTVALGLVSRSVETASNLPQPLILLPFLGSGFVPVESLPVGIRWFAEYQPFTPIIETLRGLLFGAPIGSSGAIAVAWCAGIALVSYVWAKRLFNRDPVG